MQEADISGYISNGEWDLVGKLSIPYLHLQLCPHCWNGWSNNSEMKTEIKLINYLASGIWNSWEQISDANQH